MHRRREEDPLYERFMREYEQDPYSSAARSLAVELTEKYGHRVGDHEAGLTEKGRAQAKETGRRLKEQTTYPIHAIYVSSYRRCQETFECMLETWPELAQKARVFSHDNEIVELDYGDVFHTETGIHIFHATRTSIGALLLPGHTGTDTQMGKMFPICCTAFVPGTIE